jgi:EAL domain-containing protein (putative c-di-GMP-specific phosphodiesterase class I)
MLEHRALRLLLVLSVVNGLVCTVAPAFILLRPGGDKAPVGDFVWVAALIAVALTPVGGAALWVVLRPRLRALSESRRTRHLVARIVADETVDTAFQPIVDLRRGRVIGAEALSRFRIEPDRSPDAWFAAAHSVGQGLALEEVTLRRSLARAFGLPNGCYVAVNVSPSMLTSGRLVPLLHQSGFPLARVVIEVTEHTSIDDYTQVVSARAQLKSLGVRLAVDDAGAGYASLRHILALVPDLIKIDRSLISGVDTDPIRRSMVSAVAMFALQSGASLVAEGVETAGELEALRDLGIEHAQGFLIGRPSTDAHQWAEWRAPLAAVRPRARDREVYVIPPSG